MSTSIETQNTLITENNLDPAKIKELQRDNFSAIEQLENVNNTLLALRSHLAHLSNEFGFENIFDFTPFEVSQGRINNVIDYLETGELKEEIKINA